MRRFLSIIAVAMAFVACQDGVNCVANGGEELSRAVTPEVMEQLVADLQSGVFAASDVEVYCGEECIKAFGQLEFGSIGVKGADYSAGAPILFLEGGECRMGYMAHLYSNCDKAGEHPYLYHKMSWSYDIAASTLTIHSDELSEGVYSETLKVVEYKDGKLLLEGALPMMFCVKGCTFKYQCSVALSPEAREKFNEKYSDESLAPCCKQ